MQNRIVVMINYEFSLPCLVASELIVGWLYVYWSCPRLLTLVCTGPSLIRYIVSEVSHGYLLEDDEQMYSERQRRVSTFMKTPRELEKVNIVCRK